MHPASHATADGSHPRSTTSSPPPSSASTPHSPGRRRPRADSSHLQTRQPAVSASPFLPPVVAAASEPSSKRIRISDATRMSTKAQGKLPEVVDLTVARPHRGVGGGFGVGGRGNNKMTTGSTSFSAFQPHTGAKKLVIKNLRVAPRTDDVDTYYARTWAEIEAAVASVLSGKLPDQPLERVYRGVEDVCSNKQQQRLYDALRVQCKTHLSGTVLARIRSESQGGSNLDVLRVVLRQWQLWGQQSTIIRSTFSYLDRTYLLNHRELLQINDLLIYLFRKMVFGGGSGRDKSGGNGGSGSDMDNSRPGKAVIAGMCELVALDRRGEAAFDAHLLREAVTMLHIFVVYNRYLEPPLLQQSEAFFADFADDRDSSVGLKQYVFDCEALLQREELRCNAFNFDSSTKREILDTAHRMLIRNKVPKLLDQGSISKLLENNDVGSVKALYAHLSLCGLQKRLRQPWRQYIVTTGSDIVTDMKRGDEMVVRLLLLRRGLDLMIRDALHKDEDFVFAMRESFGQFMNDERTDKAWASGRAKVGEMIAKYIDMLLRGGLKTLPEALLSDARDRSEAERNGQASTGDEDAELDRQLDQALELFRFLEGKDVFEAFYKRDLARRLLMGRSASHDAERNMLSKLKTECGSSLTHNLEQMFRDQELSRDEMLSYRQWLETSAGNSDRMDKMDKKSKKHSATLQVSVLSAAAWPTYQAVPLNLPAEVLEEVQLFDKYYKTKHSGRRLTWMHNMGQCVVTARFSKGAPKELMVSAFQATVLLLFNQAEAQAAVATAGDGSSGSGEAVAVLSYGQIATATGLEGGQLDRTLQSLACGKVRVLAKHPKGRDIAPTDTFTVNRGFTHPGIRIKINQIQMKETKEENVATYERIAADRQFETQAAIVRIMKSRKTLTHAQLVAEVINQTKSRGALEPADIKQNIEKLIEKDYLDREDGKYVYLA